MISLSKDENRRAVVLELVSNVAQAYFELLQFDMQLDIAKRTLQSWEESVKIAPSPAEGRRHCQTRRRSV